MLYPTLKKVALLLATLPMASAAVGEQQAVWTEKGYYRFDKWAGQAIGVHYSVPPDAGPASPILLVVPGAQRNASEYRDAWHSLALANTFIVLAIEASEDDFPTEFDYNAGGVVAPTGVARSEEAWTYSAIEPLFDDFKAKFGSQRQRYSLYGHSAGGQFVHTYLLFKPDARVSRAVAANPALFMMPRSKEEYPFGPHAAPVTPKAIARWLASPLVIVLGDRDVGPRTRPLSSGPRAQAQGPHVLARGLRFYYEALVTASEMGVPLAWKLEIVRGVGHSNEDVASHAVKYLFPNEALGPQ